MRNSYFAEKLRSREIEWYLFRLYKINSLHNQIIMGMPEATSLKQILKKIVTKFYIIGISKKTSPNDAIFNEI